VTSDGEIIDTTWARVWTAARPKLRAVKVRGAQVFEEFYESATDVLPPRVAGRADLLRPSFRTRYGGPLNGQARRQELVQELAQAINFDAVLETGSLRGSTTEFLRATFDKPVWTVEHEPRYFVYSKHRFGHDPLVTVELDDSRVFLERFFRRADAAQLTLFAYLDAHWSEDLPLADELTIIAASTDRCVVMIDDFAVPGDTGYRFDNYGPCKALKEDYLPVSELRGWTLLYPQASSAEETGARRGCCVLASPILAQPVQIPSLRLTRTL